MPAQPPASGRPPSITGPSIRSTLFSVAWLAGLHKFCKFGQQAPSIPQPPPAPLVSAGTFQEQKTAMKHPAPIDHIRPGSSRPWRLATAWLVALLITGCGGGGSDSGSSSGDSSGGIVPVVAPAAVTDVVATATDDTVVLTFTVPEPQNVTGFKATCVGADQTVTATGVAHGTATDEVRVVGLTNAQDQHYSCSVVAFNSGSIPSAASASVVATNSSSGNMPGQPGNTTVTAGPSSAVISFNEPMANGGSAISSYLGVCSGSDVTSSSYAVASPVVVTGLTPDVDYTCWVSGINANGVGTASEPLPVRPLANATVSADAPAAPVNVVATPGAGSASIAFDPVPGAGGAGTGVLYRATCSAALSVVSAESTGSPITVPRLDNGSTYSCVVTATTATGTSGKSLAATVVPFTVPGAPTLSAIAAGDRIATLSFTAPAFDGGSAIQGYRATCRFDTQTASADATSAGTITVAGLVNGNLYSCSVVARNAAVGTSDASASLSVTPQQARGTQAPDASQLPAPPQVTPATPGSDSASFSFTPVTGGGLTVLDYTVTCSAGNETVTATGTSSPIVVSPLRSGVTYTCWVTARTEAGSGEASATQQITLAATAPGAPTLNSVTPGNGSITLNFTTPADGGSAITGYTATCGNFPGTGSSSPITVPGLTNGTIYACSVYATSQAGGKGKASNSMSTKPRTVPGQPGSVTAVAANQSITVSYAAPADNGGADISSYIAACTNGGIRHVAESTSPNDRSITVTGLVNDKAYDCSAQAVNPAGAGAASAAASAVTPTASAVQTDFVAPEAPTVSIGDRQLSFKFDRPSGNGSDVSYSLDCSPGPISKPADSGAVTATGLTNGTEYSCQISAKRAADTKKSATVSATPNAMPMAAVLGTVTAGDGMLTIPFTKPGGNGLDVVYGASCGAGTVSLDNLTFVVSGLTNATPYTCSVSATNSAGTVLSTVTATPTVTPTPATQLTAPYNIAVKLGDASVTLSFSTDNVGGVTYSAACGSKNSFTANANGSLTVTGLTNGSTYSNCAVTVSNGTADKATAAVPSFTLPNAPVKPAIIIVTPGDGEVTLSFAPHLSGITYSATCAANDSFRRETNGNLTVTGLGNGTKYNCYVTATNDISGVKTTSAAWIVTLPAAPATPFISSAVPGDQKIVLSFSPNNESGVTYTGRCNGGTSFNKGSEGKVSVTGLTNGSPYTCTITAINSTNVSVTSAASQSVIPNQAPTARTLALDGEGYKVLSYTFTPISGETYDASCTEVNNTAISVGTAAINNGKVVVAGLNNDTTYSCAVKSTNSVGSAISASVNGTPRARLTPRTLTLARVESAALLYTFKPVPGETYAALCTVVNDTTPKDTAYVNGGELVVAGLINGTTYSCSIKSTNSTGSVRSDLVNGTPNAAPTTPTLTLASERDTSLNYTFSPVYGETYAASCTEANNPTVPAGTVTIAGSTVSVAGLSNSVTYSCTVKSTNSAGSATSNPISGTPRQGTAPGAPTEVAANAYCKGGFDPRLAVTYGAPLSDGGSDITYTVKLVEDDVSYAPSGAASHTYHTSTASNPPSATKSFDLDLSYDGYSIEVKAKNLRGESSAVTLKGSTPTCTPVTPT